MKIVYLIARILLGLVFLVFGLNGFLHFLPMSMPAGLAAQFIGALIQSHSMSVVFGLQVIGGLLLLIGIYVPLALTILGPIIFNILLFHIFMAPGGLPLALITALLWIICAYHLRSVFAGLLVARVQS